MKEYISSFRKTIRGRGRSILGFVLILCLLAALSALGLVLFIRSRRQSLNAKRRETT